MAATVSEIRAELKAIKRKMWRARDSNDKKGMLRLKARIVGLKMDLELLRERCRPRFRRSYAFDQFIEQLATGRRRQT